MPLRPAREKEAEYFIGYDRHVSHDSFLLSTMGSRGLATR
jgi:hypothetical protein